MILRVRRNFFEITTFPNSLLGVFSPRPEPQLATPQPTATTENIEYEIPSGMIEQLLANPNAGDGTEHPDMHLIHIYSEWWSTQLD